VRQRRLLTVEVVRAQQNEVEERVCGIVLGEPLSIPVERAVEHFGSEGHVFAALEIEHTHGGEVGTVLEGVTEAGAWMDGTGGEDLVGDPGAFDLRHEADGFLGVAAPVIVDGVIVDDLLVLLGLLFGPIVFVVESLDVEIRIESGFFDGLDGAEFVAGHPGDEPSIFDELDDAADEVEVTGAGPGIAQITDEEGADCAGIAGLADGGFEIGGVGVDLGEVLDLAALITILGVDLDRVRIAGIGDHGIDAVLLAAGPGFHDPFIGEVVFEQVGDIDQIAAMGVTADEIAAADDPADLDLADLAEPAGGEFDRRGGGGGGWGVGAGEEAMFLDAHDHGGAERGGERLFEEPAAIKIM